MKKLAFTVIELIFVIIVIGILSATFIPKFGQNKLSQAANQVISDIRYTQHLAMIDDKYNATDKDWYKRRWQIIFGTSTYTNNQPAYTIFADTSGTGNPDIKEIAKNPANPSQLLTGGFSGGLYSSDPRVTASMNLGSKYGITAYALSGGCSGARISFDHMGRPLKGDLSTMTGPYSAGTKRLITSQCVITLSRSNDSIKIAIEPETGYVHIL